MLADIWLKIKHLHPHLSPSLLGPLSMFTTVNLGLEPRILKLKNSKPLSLNLEP
jgi:hypothetical protein